MGETEFSPRSLTVAYWSAAALLAALLSLSHPFLAASIRSQRRDAHIVNLSGRQRMLCERIAMLSLRLTGPAEPASRERTRRDLLAAVSLMDRSHMELIDELGSVLREPRGGALDLRVHAFLGKASELARQPDSRSRRSAALAGAIFEEASGGLIGDLDDAVSSVQRLAEARVAALGRLHKSGLAASLAVLLATVLFIFRPMARRVASEQEALRALNASLEEKVAERSRRIAHLRDTYFHHINHELRTPIACVHASLSGLGEALDGRLDGREAALLEIAKRNTTNLNVMIDDLLALTSDELGKLRLDRRPFAVGKLLREVMDSLQLLAAPKGIFIDIAAPEGGPNVLADRARVRQIVVNLIGNAIKFTPERGRIDVKAEVIEEDPAALAVSVADTGPGIAPDELGSLFTRAYQAGAGRDPGLRGLGLGLFICRELVAAHGGRIWARSEPGRGSIFTFTLPLAV